MSQFNFSWQRIRYYEYTPNRPEHTQRKVSKFPKNFSQILDKSYLPKVKLYSAEVTAQPKHGPAEHKDTQLTYIRCDSRRNMKIKRKTLFNLEAIMH